MAENANKVGEQKLKTGFQRLLAKIGDVIEDAATLEVSTFTGDFTYKATQVVSNDVDKVRINKVLQKMTLENNTELKLVAYTNVKIDSDVTTIVKSNLSEDDNELLKLHKEMIESSKEARQHVINMVQGLIKKV
jgi:ATP-dependent Zn protease